MGVAYRAISLFYPGRRLIANTMKTLGVVAVLLIVLLATAAMRGVELGMVKSGKAIVEIDGKANVCTEMREARPGSGIYVVSGCSKI